MEIISRDYYDEGLADLLDAKDMLTSDRHWLSVVFCQQALEKIIK